MKVALFFCVLVAYKFARNLVRFLRLRYLESFYIECLQEDSPSMLGHQDEVIKLFKDAGIPDSVVPHAQAMGYGQVMTTRVSVFSNLTNSRSDIAQIVVKNFRRAEGVFKKRMLNSFNPLYWIDALINLPREILEYTGVSPETTLVKVVQVFYWFFGSLVAFFLAVFPAEIKELLLKLVASGH